MTDAPTARATFGLVVIGDEVLSAKVVEANAAFLLQALREIGASIREVVFVPDEVEAIAEAVRRQAPRCDVVITTGGIGPTHDDVSVAAVAAAFGVDVVEHPAILKALESLGALSEGRRRLARVPAGAELIWGEGVPWPVAKLENIWMFPGVPSFVRGLFNGLRDKFPASPRRTHRALELVVEESMICVALDELVSQHHGVAIGSYPRLVTGVWQLRLTFDGPDAEAVDAALLAALETFGSWISGS